MAVYLGQQVRAQRGGAHPAAVAGWARCCAPPAACSGCRTTRARPRAAAAARARRPTRLRDGIVFEHVSFRYPGTERWALRDVSFRIPAGQRDRAGGRERGGEDHAGQAPLPDVRAHRGPHPGGRRRPGARSTWTRGARASPPPSRTSPASSWPRSDAVGVGDLPRLDDARRRGGRAGARRRRRTCWPRSPPAAGNAAGRRAGRAGWTFPPASGRSWRWAAR